MVLDRPGNLRLDQIATPQEMLFREARTLFLMGLITSFPNRGDSAGPTWVADAIMYLSSKSREPIKLVIESDGGSVDSGLMLYDVIKMSPAPVYTIARGDCCSMAAIILSAGARGHRMAYPHARMMLHLPLGQVMGDSKEVAIRSKELTKIKDLMVDLLMENGISKTRAQLLKDIDRECWLTTEEAISYGLIDQVMKHGDLFSTKKGD